MERLDASRLTALLERLGQHDLPAENRLVQAAYGELHELAERLMAAQPGDHTLQATAVVHEAWMRLAAQRGARFENRARFFAFAAVVMRSVLVDHARTRRAAKRGADPGRVSLDTFLESAPSPSVPDVLDVDLALTRLATFDEDLARLVELRFFGGLSHPEIAALTATPLRTVERRWRLARAWLAAELRP